MLFGDEDTMKKLSDLHKYYHNEAGKHEQIAKDFHKKAEDISTVLDIHYKIAARTKLINELDREIMLMKE